MNKINLSFFIFGATLLFFSCQTQSENSRFENFLERHERFYGTYFPEGKYNPSDTSSIFQLTDNDLFEDIQFCNEQLEKLGGFDLMELSEINQESWKVAFQNLKNRLAEIETISALRNEKSEQ